MKKILIIAAVIIFVVLVALWLVVRFMYPNNIAETARVSEDAELKTRVYQADIKTVFETAKEIVPTISTYGSNWKLIDSEMENNAATVKAEVPVVVFTDDLILNLTETNGQTLVDVRSNSRVGKSDFGENRRHVLKILRRLDEKFGR